LKNQQIQKTFKIEFQYQKQFKMDRERHNEPEINDQYVQIAQKQAHSNYIDKFFMIQQLKETMNRNKSSGNISVKAIVGITKPKIFMPFIRNVPNIMRKDEPISFGRRSSSSVKKSARSGKGSSISFQMKQISDEVIQSVGEFNPEIDPNTIKKVQNRIKKRATQGVLWQNMSKKARNFSQLSNSAKEQFLKNQLMCNPSIIQETDYLDPVLLDDIQETETLLSNTKFSFEPNNPNAVFHVLQAIAQERELLFVIRNKKHPPISKDSTNKLIDFALTNETVTEDSLFLLESERPEHCFKGFVLTLDEDYGIYQNDPQKLKEFAKTTKEKIASAFKVTPSQVIIFSFGSGSVHVNFTVQNYDFPILANVDVNLRQRFPSFVKLDLHHSFFLMEISASSFDPRWNRDYRIESNCPYNEKRGNLDYFPPKGFIRYGLKVSGKFDNGNETWLGYNNEPGEWTVAYHGTNCSSVKSILGSSLRSGTHNVYGKGIYCTSKVEEAAGYASEKFTLKLQNGKKASFQYVFMCRVNVNHAHKCTEIPCPDAESSEFTVHMTKRENYWFANLNNTQQEHIRCYGLLVGEVSNEDN
jgi:hypothetical protein